MFVTVETILGNVSRWVQRGGKLSNTRTRLERRLHCLTFYLLDFVPCIHCVFTVLDGREGGGGRAGGSGLSQIQALSLYELYSLMTICDSVCPVSIPPFWQQALPPFSASVVWGLNGLSVVGVM